MRKGLRKERKEDNVITKKRLPTKLGHSRILLCNALCYNNTALDTSAPLQKGILTYETAN